MAARAKEQVLSFLASHGPADALIVADALGYETRGGAGSTLLRLHRHGHLRRRPTESGYLYSVSDKGTRWLEYMEDTGQRGPV